MTEFSCSICGESVDPLSPYTWRRITTWARTAGRRPSGKTGGSDYVGRKNLDEWAHDHCVRLEQDGLLRQEALI